MKKIPIILDGDPGHDDAIAWVLAKSNPLFDIKALVAVNGNQTIDKTLYNARRIAYLLDIDAPIGRGKEKPLKKEIISAGNWHGESGLDGADLFDLKPLAAEDGIFLMAEILKESEEKISIIATGPLSDIASLLIEYPQVKEKIECISIMGGGVKFGNWTPSAEYNIYADPEAADIVFNSGISLFMAGLDVTEKALVTPEDLERIKQINNKVSEVVYKWIDFFIRYPLKLGYLGAPVHDPCAVLMLSNPEIFKFKDLHIDIELNGEYTTGETVADLRENSTLKKNVTCALEIDSNLYIERLIESLQRYE